MKKRFLSVFLTAVMLMGIVPAANVAAETASVEVDSWYELKDALESPEELEVIVPYGKHIKYTFDYQTESASDLQISVKGKKTLNILGDITFTESVDLDKGLIGLWNDGTELTVKGSGMFKYDLPFSTEGSSVYFDSGNMFYLGGGDLTIKEDVELIVKFAWMDGVADFEFHQAVVAGVRGNVNIEGGILKCHTLLGDGIDWNISGGVFDCAGEYDADIYIRDGSLHVSGGIFYGGIKGYGSMITFDEYAVFSDISSGKFYGNIGNRDILNTPVAITRARFTEITPDEFGEYTSVNIGAFEEGEDFTLNCVPAYIPEEMFKGGVYGYASLKVMDFNGVVYSKEDFVTNSERPDLSANLKDFAPGTYMFEYTYDIRYNEETYSTEKRSFVLIIKEPIKPVSTIAVDVVQPITNESPVFSVTLPADAPYELDTSHAPTGIKWHSQTGAFVTEDHKFYNDHKYTAYIYLRAKDGYEITDATTAQVNRNGATIEKVSDGVYLVKYTFTATAEAPLYFVGLTPENTTSPTTVESKVGEELTFSFGTNTLSDDFKEKGYSISRSFAISKGLTSVLYQVTDDTSETPFSYTQKFTEDGAYIVVVRIDLKKDGTSVSNELITYIVNVAKPDYIKGDVTGDGKVNLADVSLILKKIAKWDVTMIDAAADVTGDGKTNLADVSLILKKIAKWDVEFK